MINKLQIFQKFCKWNSLSFDNSLSYKDSSRLNASIGWKCNPLAWKGSCCSDKYVLYIMIVFCCYCW